MFYYEKGSDLYSSEVKMTASEFTEITEAEYTEKLLRVQQNREQGEPVENTNEWR